MYSRYIDDCFLSFDNPQDLDQLVRKFTEKSVLNFTTETSVEGKLPFLDVLVDISNNTLKTSVFTKPTNNEAVMNARGECSDNYKKSVVAAFAKRALTHCNTWQKTHHELDRIRQLLTNNGFSDILIEYGIRRTLEKFCVELPANEHDNVTCNLFYKIFYNEHSRSEEKAIRRIIHDGVTPAPNTKINLICYYKPNKTASLIMKNNTGNPPVQSENNVVYKHTCQAGNCASLQNTYIGFTRTTLEKRLYHHRYNGGIFTHYTEHHNKRPTKEDLRDNTTIACSTSNHRRL